MRLARFCAAGPYRVNLRRAYARNAKNKSHAIGKVAEPALRRQAYSLCLSGLLQELIDRLTQVFGVVRHVGRCFKNVSGDAICIAD
jgi:hypothetical protein